MGMSQPGNRINFLIGCFWFAIADVADNCIIKGKYLNFELFCNRKNSLVF